MRLRCLKSYVVGANIDVPDYSKVLDTYKPNMRLKKYDISNPSIYICKNSNSSKGVDLNKLNLDLEALIIEMVKQAFEVC